MVDYTYGRPENQGKDEIKNAKVIKFPLKMTFWFSSYYNMTKTCLRDGYIT